jgi:hypothetical protein
MLGRPRIHSNVVSSVLRHLLQEIFGTRHTCGFIRQLALNDPRVLLLGDSGDDGS